MIRDFAREHELQNLARGLLVAGGNQLSRGAAQTFRAGGVSRLRAVTSNFRVESALCDGDAQIQLHKRRSIGALFVVQERCEVFSGEAELFRVQQKSDPANLPRAEVSFRVLFL